jgi:hypothetical protein
MLIERIIGLSNEQLGGLRGQLCPVDGCNEYDCQALCDRGCERHGTLVEGHILCLKCTQMVECANGCKVPRWRSSVLEGDRFCCECLSQEPGEDW